MKVKLADGKVKLADPTTIWDVSLDPKGPLLSWGGGRREKS